jgi:hypothetical protein
VSRIDQGYPGVLDAILFLLQQYFLPELVDLGRLPDTGIEGVGCPTAAVCDGVLGQCDDVEHCRLDVPGPVLGQRDGRWGGLAGHGDLEAKRLFSCLRGYHKSEWHKSLRPTKLNQRIAGRVHHNRFSAQ